MWDDTPEVSISGEGYMSNEKASGAQAPFDAKAAAESLQNDPSAINQLLTVILMREARLAAKEEAAEAARKLRSDKLDQNAKHGQESDLLKQARCKHMKGGRRGPKAGIKDHTVYPHTFINGETVIRCTTCSMRWKKDDTVEYLLRSGKKIKNHTRIGWHEAAAMVGQSTNTASSSEIPLDAKPREIEPGETLDGSQAVSYEI